MTFSLVAAEHRAVPFAPTGPDHGPFLQVGSLKLQKCSTYPAYCGILERPLDPAGQVPGTISIGLQFYPHRNAGAAGGTIVATEGGPGYATTQSASSYVGLFSPLMDLRDLVLVDNRGTGTSQAIDCEPLQSLLVQTVAAVGACGASLGAASDLYGTGIAADDLSAVLSALQAGPVDLYGDSYGTWFAQAFTVRHPAQVRSVILDSAYPVLGESPWYPLAAQFIRQDYNQVCQLSLSCQSLAGASLDRITALINSVRANPVSGIGHDGNGNPVNVTANAPALGQVMFANTTGEIVYRELDAAARAFTTSGDSAPLFRLLAEDDLTSGFQMPGGNPKVYSRGLFAAVSCADYPQLYNMTQPTSLRIAQDQAAFALQEATNPAIYSPFSIAEYNATSLDVSVLNLCLQWPVPSIAHPPQQSIPPGAVFPPTPVLVLSGSLDSLTTPTEGLEAAHLFPNGSKLMIANSYHVTALGDLDHCASQIARNFVLTLAPGDTSCATNITEVRTVPNFAAAFAQVQPAGAGAGNEGSADDLKAAAVATLAAGDVIARWWVNYTGSGVGLRGGTFTSTCAMYTCQYALDQIQWTSDTLVSGTMSWNFYTGAITASVSVSGAASGQFSVQWMDRKQNSIATISGVASGHAVSATMYAP